MIQSTRVLPSNAPLITEAEASSRVLLEPSGNKQHSDYSHVHSLEQKYPSSLLTENSFPEYQLQPQPQHIYHATPFQRHHFRHGQSRHQYNWPSDPARIEKQAKFLFQRFRASDQYMKYRHRQHKDNNNSDNGQDQKWPDHLELAFFQALCCWPPMGRRKILYKDKQRGRNELIADYIEDLTGERRSRKQVSSHIQVLKPFVEHDPYIMRMLSKEDLSGHLHHRWQGGRAASHHDGRRMPNYSGAAPFSGMRNAVPPMTRAEAAHLSKVRDSMEAFQPVDFQMFLQRKFGDDQVERLHTYTSSITKPLQPHLQLHDCQSTEERQLHGCQSLELDFPLLASMHKRRSLDCKILVAEASLAFPTDNFKDRDGAGLPGVELGISFLCTSRHLSSTARVLCENSFYRDGHLIKEHSQTSEVHLRQSETGNGVETQVKFGSHFWARNLAFLAAKLRNNSSPDIDPREEVSAYLNGIVASQEIIVVTGEQIYERLLIMCWKFRLSTSTTQGRAAWQRLLLPNQAATACSQAKKDSVTGYFYGYDAHAYSSSSTQQHTHHPALQSPFEYSNPGTASALSSATWPTSTTSSFEEDPNSAGGLSTGPQSVMDVASGGGSGLEDNNSHHNHGFDFTGTEATNHPFSYDANNLMSLPQLDSSAFDFDETFAADPALQDYAQQHEQERYSQAGRGEDVASHHHHHHHAQDYTVASWYDSYSAGFDGAQQPGSGAIAGGYAAEGARGYEGEFAGYGLGLADGQAFGGAGQDVKERVPREVWGETGYLAGLPLQSLE